MGPDNFMEEDNRSHDIKPDSHSGSCSCRISLLPWAGFFLASVMIGQNEIVYLLIICLPH